LQTSGNNAIGILGGTFDPIHFGHLRMAQELLQALDLTEVRFIPAATPPLKKQPITSAKDRAAMVRLAIAGNAAFSLDERELGRNGTSYTIDTLLSLRAELGAGVPLCLLMGSDAFLGLPDWQRWRELLEYCHIVIAHRANIAPNPQAMSAPLINLWERSVSTHAKDLTKKAAGSIFMQPITQLDISATRIREDLSRNVSPRYLMPESVTDFIRSHRLYVG
jgi:nicotinate-nucleotide adenylyltransferase